MTAFLDDYEPVQDRLQRFWADYPHGQILTELLPSNDGEWIVKAMVWRNNAVTLNPTDDYEVLARQVKPHPDVTGLAHEVVTSSGVNQRSALENCETSAIGRALANLGYAAKGNRASREEMEKATRETPERTDIEQNPGEWLAVAVGAYGLWTPDERREAYTQAMTDLGVERLKTMPQAKKVFKRMGDLYYEKFPDAMPF